MDVVAAGAIREAILRGDGPAFRNVQIDGPLDLAFLTLQRPLRFVNCTFTGIIDLTGADLPMLELAGSTLQKGLRAEFVHVRGPMYLNHGLTSQRQIKLTQAIVDGDIDLDRAVVAGESGRPAITLRGAQVLGSMLMHGLRATGEVRLQHIHVGGLIGLAQARIEVGQGIALNLSGAEVSGNIYLDGGFTAIGEVCAPGLRLVGALDCRGAEMTNPGGFALRLERARLDSDVRLQGLRAVGEVGFNGAVIGGDLRASGAAIDNGAGIAFGARSSHVRGSVYLDHLPLDDGTRQPFRAVGSLGLVGMQVDGSLTLTEAQVVGHGIVPAVTITGARLGGDFWLLRAHIEGQLKFARSRIGGRVQLNGITVTGRDGIAVVGEHAQVDGGIHLQGATISGGVFDLTGARTTTLVDDLPSWPEHVELDDFVYQNMPGLATRTPGDRDDRIAWLGRQQRVNASSYAHFAAVLRDHGRRGSADRVMVALHRREIAAKPERWRRAIGWLDERLLGFGYQPWRMVIALAGLIAVVAVAMATSKATATMVASDGRGDLHLARDGCASGLVRCYNPVLFAFDTIVPLLDLGHRSAWRPTRTGIGGAFEWGLAAVGIVGWAASTIFVLSFARFHRSE